jgi:hypothetical protein
VNYDFFPYSTAPAPYDVVWCRFPTVEEPSLPAEKSRPGLVRQAFQDQDGNAWVKLVYGTSVDPYRATLTDFTVATLPEMNVCGLKQATRFRLDREMTLPWSKEFFECLFEKPTPIIGHMPQYEVVKLQTQISFLQQRILEWEEAQRNDDEKQQDESSPEN